MAKPQNILIVRLSAIGDIVFSSPLITAFSKRFPDAQIAWLVQPEFRQLLEHHAILDEVIVWPRGEWQGLINARNWYALWRAVRHFKKEIRSREFDMVIDAQGLLKSGFLTWLTGAKDRIGLGSREGSQWLMTRVIDRGGDPERIGSEYLHLAKQLGLPVDHFDMQVAISPADEKYASDWIAAQNLQQGYLVICPFTTRPQKHWIETYWIELIPRLEAFFRKPVVMLGGAADQDAARRLANQLSCELINHVGETSLRQAAALIKRTDLLIGVDTGLTHMSIAFNRPTICLFGATRPYLDTTHENAVVLYHKLDCSPCKRTPTCNGRFDCMRAITVEEVLGQARRLLHAESETA